MKPAGNCSYAEPACIAGRLLTLPGSLRRAD